MLSFLRPFGILFAYPISVLYGNFFFLVFRLASVGFERCIPSLPCYLYDFLVSFLSAILCFRIFCGMISVQVPTSLCIQNKLIIHSRYCFVEQYVYPREPNIYMVNLYLLRFSLDCEQPPSFFQRSCEKARSSSVK